jgi:hypothetical protein
LSDFLFAKHLDVIREVLEVVRRFGKGKKFSSLLLVNRDFVIFKENRVGVRSVEEIGQGNPFVDSSRCIFRVA